MFKKLKLILFKMKITMSKNARRSWKDIGEVSPHFLVFEQV